MWTLWIPDQLRVKGKVLEIAVDVSYVQIYKVEMWVYLQLSSTCLSTSRGFIKAVFIYTEIALRYKEDFKQEFTKDFVCLPRTFRKVYVTFTVVYFIYVWLECYQKVVTLVILGGRGATYVRIIRFSGVRITTYVKSIRIS